MLCQDKVSSHFLSFSYFILADVTYTFPKSPFNYVRPYKEGRWLRGRLGALLVNHLSVTTESIVGSKSARIGADWNACSEPPKATFGVVHPDGLSRTQDVDDTQLYLPTPTSKSRVGTAARSRVMIVLNRPYSFPHKRRFSSSQPVPRAAPKTQGTSAGKCTFASAKRNNS